MPPLKQCPKRVKRQAEKMMARLRMVKIVESLEQKKDDFDDT